MDTRTAPQTKTTRAPEGVRGREGDALEANAVTAARAALTFLAVLLVYWPARQFAFLNFDDDEYVTDNPFVATGLSKPNVLAAFSRHRGGHYHPLTWLSHMADVSLFGMAPGPAHLVNVVIHALTTALLFWLVARCLRAPWFAMFVALFFGLHPLRIESVAWIAERKDVLSLFFALATLHAWVSYTRRPRVGWYLTVVICFVLGLLSKPTLVTLPALLLLFDEWPLGRRNRGVSARRRLYEQLPLAALSLASVLITTLSQRSEGALAASSASGWPLVSERVATAAVAYLAYLGKLFWPVGLGIFYPLRPYPPGVGAGACVALAGLTWLCLGPRRQRPEGPAVAFAWAWFMLAPLPIIGLVQFGGQAFANRWTYLCHLGLILGLASAVRDRLAPRARSALGVAAVLACALWTRHELPHWRTSESIFRHTLAVSPDNFMAHTNLGNALDAAGNLDEAATHYEEAARLNPTYPEALNNLGTLQARRNQMTEAAATFARALAIRPDMPLARYNLGLADSHLGRPVEAATEWLTLLGRVPDHPLARHSLAFVAERALAPACAAYTLSAPPAIAAAFFEALSRWRPVPDDAGLAQTLANLTACLR